MAFPLNMRAAFGVSSPSAMPQQDMIGDYINRVAPFLRGQREQMANMDLANKIKLMDAQSKIEQYGTSTPASYQKPTSGPGAPMNTVMAPGSINPLQAAQLALKQAAEQGKDKRTEESIAGREKIASQAETGRTGRAQLRSETSKSISDEKLKLGMKQLGLKEDQFDYFKQIHNMSDSDRIKAVQDGKISMEDLKNSHALEQIGARGDVDISNIQERGKQQRTTQGSKPLLPSQQQKDYFNKANQLLDEHPEYKEYIKINPSSDNPNSFRVNPGSDENIYHSINSQIYGKDIQLPSEGKPESMNDETYKGGGKVQSPEEDTSNKEVTQYQQGDDPAGLFS